MKRLVRYIPSTIDWEQIQQMYPLPNNVTVASLNYFLGYLTYRKVFDRELKDGDPVPVHAKTMIKVLTNYFKVKEYLKDARIIISSEKYVPGKESKSYKFTPEYSGELTRVEITDTRILSRFRIIRKELARKSRSKNKLLSQFFSKKLKIDMSKINGQCVQMINDNPDWCNENWSKINFLLQSASMIHSGEYFFKTDSASGRLHTNLTNLRKEARGYLNYNGQQLGSVDISCSQPYLLGGFLLSEMYLGENKFIATCLEHCSKKTKLTIRKNIQQLGQIIKITPDLISYVKHVEAGSIYEFFWEEVNKILFADCRPIITDRKFLKTNVIKIFYCDNKYYRTNYYREKLVEIFKIYFPTVFNAIYILKKNNHRAFSCLLQAMESELVTGMIAPDCVNRCMAPIYTIHDSIVSVVKNIPEIEKIMYDNLFKITGVKPNLKAEIWEPKSLFTSD